MSEEKKSEKEKVQESTEKKDIGKPDPRRGKNDDPWRKK